MRICFSHPRLFRAAARSGRQVESLIRRMQFREHQVSVVSTPAAVEKAPEDLVVLRLPFDGPTDDPSPQAEAAVRERLAQYLRETAAEWVFADGLSRLTEVVARAANDSDLPLIVRARCDTSGICHDFGDVPGRDLRRRIEAMLARADVLAAAGPTCRMLLRETFGADSTLVPDGVDLNAFRFGRTTRRDLEGFLVRVGAVGRRLLLARLDTCEPSEASRLLTVLREVHGRLPAVMLYLLTEAEAAPAFQRMITDAGGTDAVVVGHSLDPRDSFAAYTAAEVLLVADGRRVQEGACLDAMAMHVAPAIPLSVAQMAPSYLIDGETALFLDENDPVAAGAALVRLLEDAPRLQGIQDEALRASQPFDLRTAVERVEEIVARTLRQSPANAGVDVRGLDRSTSSESQKDQHGAPSSAEGTDMGENRDEIEGDDEKELGSTRDERLESESDSDSARRESHDEPEVVEIGGLGGADELEEIDELHRAPPPPPAPSEPPERIERHRTGERVGRGDRGDRGGDRGSERGERQDRGDRGPERGGDRPAGDRPQGDRGGNNRGGRNDRGDRVRQDRRGGRDERRDGGRERDGGRDREGGREGGREPNRDAAREPGRERDGGRDRDASRDRERDSGRERDGGRDRDRDRDRGGREGGRDERRDGRRDPDQDPRRDVAAESRHDVSITDPGREGSQGDIFRDIKRAGRHEPTPDEILPPDEEAAPKPVEAEDDGREWTLVEELENEDRTRRRGRRDRGGRDVEELGASSSGIDALDSPREERRRRGLEPGVTLRDLIPFLRPPKQVVICGASTGSGHLRVAHAVTEGLKILDRNLTLREVDLLDHLAAPYRAPYVRSVLEDIQRRPALFGAPFETSPLTAAEMMPADFDDFLTALFAEKLQQSLLDRRPEWIVCSHWLPFRWLEQQNAAGVTVPKIVAVASDPDYHDYWWSPLVKFWLVSNADFERRLVARGVPPENIQVVGVPVNQAFSLDLAREPIARELGLRKDVPTVMIRPGGIGQTDRIVALVRRLMASTFAMNVLVVAGKNDRLREELEQVPVDDKCLLKSFGFVDNIHELMTASDMLVTRATPHTVAEAIACGLPMLLIRPTPGVEERVADRLLAAGVAVAVRDEGGLESEILDMVRNRRRVRFMRDRALELDHPNATASTVEKIMRLVK